MYIDIIDHRCKSLIIFYNNNKRIRRSLYTIKIFPIFLLLSVISFSLLYLIKQVKRSVNTKYYAINFMSNDYMTRLLETCSVIFAVREHVKKNVFFLQNRIFFFHLKSSISGFSCFKDIYIYTCKKKLCPLTAREGVKARPLRMQVFFYILILN